MRVQSCTSSNQTPMGWKGHTRQPRSLPFADGCINELVRFVERPRCRIHEKRPNQSCRPPSRAIWACRSRPQPRRRKIPRRALVKQISHTSCFGTPRETFFAKRDWASTRQSRHPSERAMLRVGHGHPFLIALPFYTDGSILPNDSGGFGPFQTFALRHTEATLTGQGKASSV